MSWEKVGGWLKNNAGTGAALVGSLLTGNVPGAVAAGISMVSSATGSDDPDAVLTALQGDPGTVVKLKEIAAANEADIRRHLESIKLAELEDQQKEHAETQVTIRAGDTASDEYVRHTRPRMARQSWFATVAYCLGCFGVRAASDSDVFDIMLAGILFAPAGAYLGLRTVDKYAPGVKDAIAGALGRK